MHLLSAVPFSFSDGGRLSSSSSSSRSTSEETDEVHEVSKLAGTGESQSHSCCRFRPRKEETWSIFQTICIHEIQNTSNAWQHSNILAIPSIAALLISSALLLSSASFFFFSSLSFTFNSAKSLIYVDISSRSCVSSPYCSSVPDLYIIGHTN